MENKALELCAYHESGRVVFAYQQGYSCYETQLSDTDAGAGDSRLSGEDDNQFIEAVFSGSEQVIVEQSPTKAMEVAKILMKITCAGACAAKYFSDGLKFVPNTEIEIPSQDVRYMDMIQNFMTDTDPNHPEDYPVQVMQQIFEELGNADLWKAIDMLAKAAMRSEGYKMTAFSIKDTLMAAGFEFKEKRSQGVAIGLSNEPVKKPATESSGTTEQQPSAEQVQALTVDVMLDMVLTDFLKRVKKDWNEDALQESVAYLKGIFVKFKKRS